MLQQLQRVFVCSTIALRGDALQSLNDQVLAGSAARLLPKGRQAAEKAQDGQENSNEAAQQIHLAAVVLRAARAFIAAITGVLTPSLVSACWPLALRSKLADLAARTA